MVLFAVAVTVSADEIQAWLMAHPRQLYYGVSALHVVTVPAVMMAVVAGYGRTDQELLKSGPGLLGWMVALFLCSSFIVPGVLGLALDSELWVMMSTIFGPFVLLPVIAIAAIVAEKHGWVAPARVSETKAWWKVQALALLAWAYLLWLETMMLVAASKGGPLAEVGLPLGVLLDYVPVRVMLCYVRQTSKWEVATIAATTLHLVIRLAATG